MSLLRKIYPGESGVWLVLLWAFFLVVSFGTGRAQTVLTLRGDAVEGEEGQDVKILFRTEGFWQITDGMGTIQWNPQVADYVSAGDFGIPELNSGTFTRIPEGMLSFDWSSDNPLGNTLADGSILFSLTFNIRGAPGDSTAIAFTNSWTELHFESAENIDLQFTSVSGAVSVVPEPSTSFLVIGGVLFVAALRTARSRAELDPMHSKAENCSVV